ncbi:hypothetical protein ACIBCO_21470 [Streptomyces violascens]|uniref:hypothetical protein n=1 Tax=Streptomyces violascens TaxID=67381 RepID=UPI003787E7F7
MLVEQGRTGDVGRLVAEREEGLPVVAPRRARRHPVVVLQAGREGHPVVVLQTGAEGHPVVEPPSPGR